MLQQKQFFLRLFSYFCLMYNYSKVVLALGSNLGDKRKHLLSAIQLIHNQIGFVADASAVYETPSWGFNSFPFYNMCIIIHTHYGPEELLQKLKTIEFNLGRISKTNQTYQARTIDIDIIYYNDLILASENLTIPHPQIQFRNFVLVPLAEVVPDWQHPVLKLTADQILNQSIDTDLIKKAFTLSLPKEKFHALQKLKFIAIEGNIGAGKTTLTKMIAHDFNALPILERYKDNAFLPKFYKEPARYAFPLEMSFLADRYTQLQKEIGQYNLFNDFIIADYYIYKSLVFAQVTLDTDEVL